MKKATNLNSNHLSLCIAMFIVVALALIFTTNSIYGQIIYSGNQDIVFDTPAIIDNTLTDKGMNGFNARVAAPTVTLSSAGPSMVYGLFEIDIEFSEPVMGFVEGDFTITNGSIEPGSLLLINALHYKILIVPQASGKITIYLPENTCESVTHIGNLESNSLTFLADYDSPRIELSSSASEPVSGVFTIDISFSEEVFGLQEYEIKVSNGFIRAGSLVNSDGINYELSIIPATSGEVIIHVPANVAQDADANGNLASEALVVNANVALNIDDQNSQNKISCYPNPNQGNFTLKISDEFLNSTLEILNSAGIKVFVSLLDESITDFDLSNYPQGAYLIRVFTDEQIYTNTFIID